MKSAIHYDIALTAAVNVLNEVDVRDIAVGS